MNQGNSNCGGCDGDSDRREFVRTTVRLAAGILVGLGMSPANAAAAAIHATAGRRRGSEVAYPIPTVDGATIDKTNEVILARHAGMVYAFSLSCPHQNTALHWLDDEGRFQCPKHKSRYQPDGTFISGRATRNMDRLPIRRDGNQVMVNVDRVFESDTDPAGWAGAAVKA